MQIHDILDKKDSDENIIGTEIRTDNHLVFFGNSTANLDRLQVAYPQYKFAFLKQVHGDKVIQRKDGDGEPEADGHYTDQKHLALCIITADCLPVMYYTEKEIVALHCGWRGVAQQIAKASLEFVTGPIGHAFVGPHIPYSHFEVHKDVAQDIVKNYNGFTEVEFEHPDPEKSFVDLATIVQNQLQLEDDDQFWVSSENTLTNEDYSSYRRNQSTSRNISFICKL